MVTDPDGDLPTERSAETVVEATGIEKSYDSLNPFGRSVEVLNDASLRVERGEVVGVMGGNGSGKSTLMGILAGVLDQDAGTVERSGRIGWCPQQPRLYERLTVDETFELFGAAYGMSDAEIAESSDWLADVLDFDRFRGRQVRHLSGGNRQKVNLSVALIHEPNLLLLDEPYTGFDWETFLAFWDLTDELRERGVGVAIVSHVISERDRFDVVYELHDGRLHRRAVGTDGDLVPEPTGDDTDCDRDAPVADDRSGSDGRRRVRREGAK